MPDISDVYGTYLEPEHIPDDGIDTAIERVKLSSRFGKKTITVWFKDIGRPLKLTKLTATSIIDIAGTETDKWVNTAIRICKVDGSIAIQPKGDEQ